MLHICAYRSPPALPEILTSILPPTLTEAVLHCGAPAVEEIRLHACRRASVTCGGKNFMLPVVLSAAETDGLLKRMCAGSLYAFGETICRGYLTLEGGIRVGICGNAAVEHGKIIGIDAVSGLVIRLPHAVNTDATPLLERLLERSSTGGMLIYAPPGIGKTTVLRAVARTAASSAYSLRTVVVDTRKELETGLAGEDLSVDVLSGYPPEDGIEIAVRCLNAQLILCDEIGSRADADAILSAANCGVPVIASAHAATLRELLSRPSILSLHRSRVFGYYTGIRRGSGTGFLYHFSDWQEAETEVTAL